MIFASFALAGTLDGLVSANGRGAVVYEVDSSGYGVLSRFSDHLYQKPDAASDETWDLLYDSYFGRRADGVAGWLTQSGGASVEEGTGIVVIDRSEGDLVITEYVFASMDLAHPGFVHLLRVENGGAAVPDLQLFSLHNYHLGPEAGTADESLSDEGWLTEVGESTGLVMHVLPLGEADIGCDAVWQTVNDGGDLGGDCPSAGDDRVGGLQWSVGALDAGEVAWVGTVQVFSSGWDRTSVPGLVQAWVASRGPEELLEDERAAWADWAGELPAGVSADEASVYRQQLAWLRMAQVREDGDAHGQIVASLPYADGDFTHVWNIAWARDGAYAARALAEAGHPEEAEAALAFMAQEGKSGAYVDYVGGQDYLVSLCRYYGDGTEWSDEDDNGPNIELDDWGLYLWALRGAVAARASTERVAAALDGVADPLVGVIDETGLIQADSSIWERHWNGNQKHFSYSSAWAVRGLRDAAELAELVGDGRADAYRETADGIAAAMIEQLVHDDVLLGNAEEDPGAALDLAAVDAFGNGAVEGLAMDASLAAWEALRVATGGFHRNDDGDSYDEQEWIFVDLRLAEALFRDCRTTEAQALLDHVTAVALDNQLVLPELLDPSTGEVEGPAPMIGFGAGVYALALHARADTDCAADSGDSGDSGGTDTDRPEDSGDPGDSGDSGDSGGPGADTDPSDSADDGFYRNALGVEGCACDSGHAGPGGLLLALGLLRRHRR